MPWSLAEGHGLVCVELKMQGDHLDFAMLQRALLRRQALEVLRADAERTRVQTEHIPLWIVAASIPSWVSNAYPMTRLEAGSWSVGGGGGGGAQPALVWVASNELGLREDLIPFLITRTGLSLAAFARWVVTRRSPAWVLDMLQILPMPPHPLSELLSVIPSPTDDPDVQERRRMIARSWLDVVTPEVKQELLDKGLETGLAKGLETGLAPLLHQFERKLARPLTDGERRSLLVRLDELGPDKLGDVVLDMDADALGAWLGSSTG